MKDPWRFRASNFAIIELIIIVCTLAQFIIVLEPIAHIAVSTIKGDVEEEEPVLVWIMLTSLFVGVILLLLGLWAVLKLRKATDPGTDTEESLKVSGIWIYVTVPCFLVQIAGCIYFKLYFILATVILYRGASLLVVQRFRAEVRCAHETNQKEMEGTPLTAV